MFGRKDNACVKMMWKEVRIATERKHMRERDMAKGDSEVASRGSGFVSVTRAFGSVVQICANCTDFCRVVAEPAKGDLEFESKEAEHSGGVRKIESRASCDSDWRLEEARVFWKQNHCVW